MVTSIVCPDLTADRSAEDGLAVQDLLEWGDGGVDDMWNYGRHALITVLRR